MITSLIVAADEDDVIGRDGRLPWHLSEDLRRFRRLTTGHVMVAGRTTHESIVDRLGRALPDRVTIVVSRAARPAAAGVIFEQSLGSALAAAHTIEEFGGGGEVFVIGGAQVYAEALDRIDRIHLTRVHRRVVGDTRMPAGWLGGFQQVDAVPQEGFTWQTYERG